MPYRFNEREKKQTGMLDVNTQKVKKGGGLHARVAKGEK